METLLKIFGVGIYIVFILALTSISPPIALFFALAGLAAFFIG